MSSSTPRLNAQQAAQYANAFAQAYITYRNDSVLKPLAAAVAKIKRSMTALEEQLLHSGTARRPVLQCQLRSAASQLQAFQSDQQLVSGGQVIGTAVPPSSPSSPKIATTLVIAAVIGLVLGIILALIREGMDRRIKSPGEMESQLRAPVLGVIPKFKGRSPERSLVAINEPRSPASEAYRTAAIALENLATRTGARVIMIVSPKEGGGASTATANLGAVLAQAGRQVILVSADLRNPTLHLILGLPDGRGLSTAVTEAKNTERFLKATRVPNLFLLNAGPEPEDPGGAALQPCHGAGLQRSASPETALHTGGRTARALGARRDDSLPSRRWDRCHLELRGLPGRGPPDARERLGRAGANILGGIYSFASGKRGGAQPGG